MHCDKLLFYICLSKKKPYRAYVVMLLYSTVNKSSMSMSMSNASVSCGLFCHCLSAFCLSLTFVHFI